MTKHRRGVQRKRCDRDERGLRRRQGHRVCESRHLARRPEQPHQHHPAVREVAEGVPGAYPVACRGERPVAQAERSC